MIGQDRNGVLVAVLMLLTCGIYGMWLQWVTTDELAQATGNQELSPGKDLLLTLVTCGLWSIYVMYRNAEVIAEAKRRYGVQAESKGNVVLILTALACISGITAVVGPVIIQDELNGLWRLMREQSAGSPAQMPATF